MNSHCKSQSLIINMKLTDMHSYDINGYLSESLTDVHVYA